MKKFIKPNMELYKFDVENIVTESGTLPGPNAGSENAGSGGFDNANSTQIDNFN